MHLNICNRGAKHPPPNKLNSAAPPMDLSSLEGPPIIEPRSTISPRATTRDLRQQTPLPTTNTSQSLFPCSLPPRPASTDAVSSRQPQRRERGDQPTSAKTGSARTDGVLQRAPAQRGRRDSPEEIRPDSAPRDDRSRSPRTPSDTQPDRCPRQPLVRHDLVWLEDEKLWMIAETSNSQPPPEPQGSSTRAPPTPSSPPSSPASSQPTRHDNDDLGSNDSPPPYESHDFSPTYIMPPTPDTTFSRWSSVARHMYNLPTA